MCNSTASRPYLDNRGTTGAPQNSPAFQKVQTNKRRAYAVSNYRRSNLKLAGELELALQARQDMPEDEAENVLKFIQNIRGCGSHSLFRQFNSGELSYIGSHTCDSKLCQVCNSQRKRKIRKMYYRYFEERPELVQEYDFMHLTLTVPHTEEGWKGERIYIKPLLRQFSEMRKKNFWKKRVYAGEYTVEFTRNHNGLHIHIHALLLVKKGIQNRNRLYRNIFRAWNMQTVWDGAKRQKFSEKQRFAIAKALSMKPDSDEFYDYFLELHPTGSTLCSLESLYIMKDGKKKYVNSGNEKEFMAGIMECLKYHFEPCKIKKDPKTKEEYTSGLYHDSEGNFNTDLLLEVIPAIKNQRLYAKIGKFYGDARLNINQKDNLGQLMEAVKNQFESNHSFHIEGYDRLILTTDSQRAFEQGLRKRKIDVEEFGEVIEDFINETDYGYMDPWKGLNNLQLGRLKNGLGKWLDGIGVLESDKKKVVAAFGACFHQEYRFKGIKPLREYLKQVFGSYYIEYAGMIVEILRENGVNTDGDIDSEIDPLLIISKIREALKKRLELLEKEEEAKDNSSSEDVVNPETLIPALITDYNYKIFDIGTVFIPRSRKLNKNDKPLYGEMRNLGDPRYEVIFYGKLGKVVRNFIEFIQNELKDSSQEKRLKRKVLQAKRMTPNAA